MRRARPTVAFLLGGALVTGCSVTSTQRRTTVPPDRLPAVLQNDSLRPRYLKAHLRDGRALVFDSWTLQGRAVEGQGRTLDINRDVVATGRLSMPFDSVVLFETNEVRPSQAGSGLAIPMVITLGLAVYCAANPKACFGSCPTFYASDGERDLLMAEGFSASVAPALEATDVDALARARPEGRRLTLRMTNEAMETHVVRFARVVAAPRSAGQRVFATRDGRFVSASEPRAPLRCVAAEGDCTAAVSAFDGRERFSTTDSADLATREVVDLAFAARPAGPLGVVIATRQTLLTTYVFYQGLAYLGTRATDFLAALERGVPGTRTAAVGAGNLLGGIDVQVPEGDGWRTVGEYRETGPLGTDVRLVPLPDAPSQAGAPVRVRLRLTRGLWRLDQVGLVSLGDDVRPVRLEPAEVRHRGVVDEEARAALGDSARTVVTFPGDEYTLRYDLPDDPARLELFLETRGYYLEWMRREWLAEEDLARAARLFGDPARALREMAPAFKRLEPGMERAFWGSRYVRH